jgi:hypothetical protein
MEKIRLTVSGWRDGDVSAMMNAIAMLRQLTLPENSMGSKHWNI